MRRGYNWHLGLFYLLLQHSLYPSLSLAFFFFLITDSTDSPDCLPILLSLSVFTFSSFFRFFVFDFVR